MEYRQLGKTGEKVSAVGFGAWAIGGSWGPVHDDESLAALHRAADAGVNFFDTADVYGDGRSERLIARFIAERPAFVATKMGRSVPQVPESYVPENFRRWIDGSLSNLGVERLDLIQLHCPPTDVYYRPEVFEALDGFVADGKLKAWGVSVERVEEALKAIEYPGCATVQIIYNMFRQRPAEGFFAQAKARDVGIIVRVPLASGLLTGKFDRTTTFDPEDHRNFNRDGSSFDVGETFAGVDYETGLDAVEEIRGLVPDGVTMAQFALRWILMDDNISTVIPGARNPEQAAANAVAADLPPLPGAVMDQIAELYRSRIAPLVHHRW
jgi:aryl-alcohol dehydrogenase-like predicted oxidoreductase